MKILAWMSKRIVRSHWETNPSSFLSLLCIAPPKKAEQKSKNERMWENGVKERRKFLFFSYLNGSHCSFKSGQTVIEKPQNGDNGIRDALALS